MLIGCIFCHYVHSAKGTLNTHLNLYVPEMAAARGVPPEEDAQHHVGMIRELRWVERSRFDHKINWQLSPDPDVRAVLQAFSTLIYHPVTEAERDSFRCRLYREVDTDFWSARTRAALSEYRSRPLQTRRWYLDSAVQEALQAALSISEMRVPRPAAPVGLIAAKGEIMSIRAGNVGPNAQLSNSTNKNTGSATGLRKAGGNTIDGSFNGSLRTMNPIVLSSGSSAAQSDEDLPDPIPLRRKLTKKTPSRPRDIESEDDDDDDDDDQPRVATRRQRVPIPDFSPSPPPRTKGKGKAVARALHTFPSDSDDAPQANTTRSPSVFASPSRAGSRPAYTSTALWNSPVSRARTAPAKRSFARDHGEQDMQSPVPLAAKKSRYHSGVPARQKTPAARALIFDEDDDDDDAPRRTITTNKTPLRPPPSAPIFSPPIDPLFTLSIAVFGSHHVAVRVYPGLDLVGVLSRAFADAPKELVALRRLAGIRGVAARPVAGWKRIWDEEMWRLVVGAARQCAVAPEWRAEVVFVGE